MAAKMSVLGLIMFSYTYQRSAMVRFPLEIDSPSDSSDALYLITQNEMSLKMECHLKWNITQNGTSLKM